MSIKTTKKSDHQRRQAASLAVMKVWRDLYPTLQGSVMDTCLCAPGNAATHYLAHLSRNLVFPRFFFNPPITIWNKADLAEELRALYVLCYQIDRQHLHHDSLDNLLTSVETLGLLSGIDENSFMRMRLSSMDTVLARPLDVTLDDQKNVIIRKMALPIVMLAAADNPRPFVTATVG